ncbi:MAG TPA: hypothetical protein VI548_01655 [Chitinophagaceae bacterium]|nr:hypothetical protein [Chitinophagaceae bacterium]
MARPHHRKKHKAHLREYQKSNNSLSTRSKGKGTNVFAIVGAVLGLAIGYFAADGQLIWMIGGLLAGGAIGYFAGKKIDESGKS